MEKFLLIDKEKGMTSFDVVREVRRMTGERRVGHSGTLDPLATGLLIVAVGRAATKKLGDFLRMDKEYEVLARLGKISDSYDADGKIEKFSDKKIARAEVEKSIHADFLGELLQIPPKFSAKKIKGVRAYELARAGKDVKLEPKKVQVYEFSVLDFKWPMAKFKIHCGSGTYVRSLIHDLGQKLGCGAYVEELRRTKIGEYSVEQAVKLD